MAEFVEDLPAPAKTGGRETGRWSGRRDTYSEFADDLKAKPFNWALWPTEVRDKNHASTIVSSVRRGDYKDFRPPTDWQVAQRRGKVYARFIGELGG